MAYYVNAYQTDIVSKVIECIESERGYDIVLKDTCFYPEGGGQPADKGILNGQEVLDVQERNGIVYHSVKQPIKVGSVVKGEIDWGYRFNLMQNHTAEHILSGLVQQKYGFHNVGFHMGKEFVTVDFDGELSEEDVGNLDVCVNTAIMLNRPVRAYYPKERELKKMDYRSKKELKGRVRIVEVKDYDVCACCGIHVKSTGEIGCARILSFEAHKGGTRLCMVAGQRGYYDYYMKHISAKSISHTLSVPVKEIAAAVKKLKKERDELRYQLNVLEKEKLEKIAETVEQGSKKAVFFQNISNAKTMQYFADLLSQKVDVAAVFSGDDEKGYTYVLMSQKWNMKELKQKLSEMFECNGGGTEQMIQGKIVSTEADIVYFFVNNV